MTSLDDDSPVQGLDVCCRQTMGLIEVTSPLGEGTWTLSLQTCSLCGRHVWHRDGEVLNRDAVIAIVRDRMAEPPAVPSPRPAPEHSDAAGS